MDLHPFCAETLFSMTAEDVFAKLVSRGNGGTIVRSTASPAMSTQFVKSEHDRKVKTDTEGALVEIVYPSSDDINRKLIRKYGSIDAFGYEPCGASAAYTAGFGERSARALCREENTYQLKGTFPVAMMSHAKLRARVEAREGNVEAIDQIFATMWGIDTQSVAAIPKVHLDGSEATRMSAMEDRAYHALSGHPGHSGGYRIDMATITPDVLGPDVPLNWPRIRTGMKAIAQLQRNGDIYVSELIRRVQKEQDARFGMSLVVGSQPIYNRPYPWETIVQRLMTSDEPAAGSFMQPDDDIGLAMHASFHDTICKTILENEEHQLYGDVGAIAKTVVKFSTEALTKTIEVMLTHDRERARLEDSKEADYHELDQSHMSASFEIPRYKVTSTSLRIGVSRQFLGRDDLPDITSHGNGKHQLDLREFREAHLMVPIDIRGALNMAVYLTTTNPHMAQKAYLLMSLTPAPNTPNGAKATVRLRRQSLYDDSRVRSVGMHLFGDIFMNTFELLVRNMASQEYHEEVTIKREIWSYLAGRCGHARKCPYPGGWRDLIVELRTCPEGWSLYYWARISIGNMHHVMSSGVFATIVAGKSVDFLSAMRSGIAARAKYWSGYYSAEYKKVEDKLTEARKPRIKPTDPNCEHAKYIPPHLRKNVDLEDTYDANEILSRDRTYEAAEYERMVEMQSKSKFFSMIRVSSNHSRLSVGISDENMRQLLIEFYQARWFSLEKRIEKATKQGVPFQLGPYSFTTHPWGELCTEFPMSYLDMLAFLVNLDGRAWTLQPGYLQDKFRKSLSELWNDITSELDQVRLYVEDVFSGLLDAQEVALESQQDKSPMVAMINVDAIPIPTTGYIPPYTRPPVTLTLQHGDTTAYVKTLPTTFTDPTQHVNPSTTELDDLDDLDELDDVDMVVTAGGLCDSLQGLEQSYLTPREIWHLLTMPEVDDAQMAFAFSLSEPGLIDEQHTNTQQGPVILKGEEKFVTKKWASRRGILLKRSGTTTSADDTTDM